MKYFLFVMLVALCLNADADAQNLKSRQWTSLKMPGDTLSPVALEFYDSVHGYFCGVKAYAYYDSTGRQQFYSQTYFYETSNGGKSWVPLLDSIFTNVNNGYGYGGWGGGWGWGGGGGQNRVFQFANLQHRYVSLANGRGDLILYRSTDYGKTWKKVSEQLWQHVTTQFLTTYGSNSFFTYKHDSALLARTTDGGATFPYQVRDSTFRMKLWPDSGDYLGGHPATTNFIFRDPFHITCMYQGDKKNYPKLFPLGLHTLVTSNGGYSWEHFSTPIPGETDSTSTWWGWGGGLQYARGTSDLYSFTGWWGEGGYWWWGYNDQSKYWWDFGNYQYGNNYLYSPDDGRTWTPQMAFAHKRRGYEVVKKNELWFTLTRHDMKYGEPYEPAYILTRTTDNGVTWEEDSTTLYVGEWPVDGRIITFSDPRHGWIAAVQYNQTYIFRYDANEQPLNTTVEPSDPENPFMTLFPLPANDEVNITIPKDKRVKNVEIYDIMGRKMTTTFTSEGNTATASVRGFTAGSYVVIVLHESGTYSRPLIVEPK